MASSMLRGRLVEHERPIDASLNDAAVQLGKYSKLLC
jgi:hypothetical protein